MIASIPWLRSATLLDIIKINLEEISGKRTWWEPDQDRKQWRELLVAALILGFWFQRESSLVRLANFHMFLFQMCRVPQWQQNNVQASNQVRIVHFNQKFRLNYYINNPSKDKTNPHYISIKSCLTDNTVTSRWVLTFNCHKSKVGLLVLHHKLRTLTNTV
jgi:hypothetical protein